MPHGISLYHFRTQRKYPTSPYARALIAKGVTKLATIYLGANQLMISAGSHDIEITEPLAHSQQGHTRKFTIFLPYPIHILNPRHGVKLDNILLKAMLDAHINASLQEFETEQIENNMVIHAGFYEIKEPAAFIYLATGINHLCINPNLARSKQDILNKKSLYFIALKALAKDRPHSSQVNAGFYSLELNIPRQGKDFYIIQLKESFQILNPLSQTYKSKLLLREFIDKHQTHEIYQGDRCVEDDVILENAIYHLPSINKFIYLAATIYDGHTYSDSILEIPTRKYRAIGRLLGVGSYAEAAISVSIKPVGSKSVHIKNDKIGAVRIEPYLTKDIEKQYSIAGLQHQWGNKIKSVATLPITRNYHLFYSTMKLLKGPEASLIIDEHRFNFTPLLFLNLAKRYFLALKEIHDNGIIHNDVKPNNCKIEFFGTDFEVTIYDPNLSKRKGDPNPYPITGTPDYMSPEAARTSDADSTDESSDIYGAILTLIELSGGLRKSIFLSKEEIKKIKPEELKLKIINKTAISRIFSNIISIDTSTQQALFKIIQKSLDIDQKNRYPNAQAILIALDEVYDALIKKKRATSAYSIGIETEQLLKFVASFWKLIRANHIYSDFHPAKAIKAIIDDALDYINDTHKECNDFFYSLSLYKITNSITFGSKNEISEFISSLIAKFITLEDEFLQDKKRIELKFGENKDFLNSLALKDFFKNKLIYINEIYDKHEFSLKNMLIFNESFLYFKNTAKNALIKYQSHASNSFFFRAQRIFDLETGRERAKYYLNLLEKVTLDFDACIIIYALLTDSKGGKVLKEFVVKSLGYDSLSEVLFALDAFLSLKIPDKTFLSALIDQTIKYENNVSANGLDDKLEEADKSLTTLRNYQKMF